MKFFVPMAKSEEDSEKVYIGIAKFVDAPEGTRTLNLRIDSTKVRL
jgi:hypothetical protein